MDQTEARALLDAEIEALRRLSYDQLRDRVPRVKSERRVLGITFQRSEGGDPQTRELTGPSGAWYQLEIECFFDDAEEGNIRVMVAIDDGGASAYRPMTDDFIRAPDGSFVDE